MILIIKNIIFFIGLYRGGFRITRTNDSEYLRIYRFWWMREGKLKIIQEMPDINQANKDHWSTVHKGHANRLSSC